MEQIYVVVSAKVDCTDKQGYAHSGVDPECDVARKIAQWIGDGVVVDDTKISDREVLVGFTDRKETEAFLSRLQKNQYGVARFGEKILVCGHCVASVVMAAEYLLSSKPEDVTEDFCQILTYDGWITDVPEFDGNTWA